MENERMEEYRNKIRLSADVILSVAQTPYTYGGPQGLYEIALLSNDGDFVTHEYFPDIEDDVIGYLELSDVDDIIEELLREMSPL